MIWLSLLLLSCATVATAEICHHKLTPYGDTTCLFTESATFNVPLGVENLTVFARGGDGEASLQQSGGAGGAIGATFGTIKGDKISISIGSHGQSMPNRSNVTQFYESSRFAGVGGKATVLSMYDIDILVAGAGGGAAGKFSGGDGAINQRYGHVGRPMRNTANSDYLPQPADGGGLFTHGDGCRMHDKFIGSEKGGSNGNGFSGGKGADSVDGYPGGGGGDGLFGGGGGCSGQYTHASGAGGSSGTRLTKLQQKQLDFAFVDAYNFANLQSNPIVYVHYFKPQISRKTITFPWSFQAITEE